MIIYIMSWLSMAALAFACGFQLGFFNALFAWNLFTAAGCAGGAWLISRQPVGIATPAGRLGACFVRWGFRAGQGQLMPAASISWVIWLVLGSATISGIHFPEHLPIVAAWTGDSLGLLYIIGVMLSNRGGRPAASLMKMACGLLGLISGSAFLWFHAATDGARAVAVTVAGGPPLLVALGYGFVIATSLIGARKHN